MTLQLRKMTAADVALGMKLKTQAKWNQVEADWRRFLALEPEGCFVAELDGQGVGTATTCVLGSVAWIAMVLVDEAARGKGVGTALLGHALAYLDQRQVQSVRLDATPAGQPLYEKLGFQGQFELVRYQGEVLAPEPADQERVQADAALAAAGMNGRAMVAADLPEVVALDGRIVAGQRGKLLEQLWREEPGRALVVEGQGRLLGYALGRAGAQARQLGPVGALEEAAGHWLLGAMLRVNAGSRVYVDVAANHVQAGGLCRRVGLTVQRPFLRMCRGVQQDDRVAWLWASSGPEKG